VPPTSKEDQVANQTSTAPVGQAYAQSSIKQPRRKRQEVASISAPRASKETESASEPPGSFCFEDRLN
jgi:hypothetical protein